MFSLCVCVIALINVATQIQIAAATEKQHHNYFKGLTWTLNLNVETLGMTFQTTRAALAREVTCEPLWTYMEPSASISKAPLNPKPKSVEAVCVCVLNTRVASAPT